MKTRALMGEVESVYIPGAAVAEQATMDGVACADAVYQSRATGEASRRRWRNPWDCDG